MRNFAKDSPQGVMRYYYGKGLIRVLDDGSAERYFPAIEFEGTESRWEPTDTDYASIVFYDRGREWDEVESADGVQKLIAYEDEKWWNWVPSRLRKSNASEPET